MKKILVPVDFSEHTEKTCSYALEIAKRFNSEIRLFHSYFDQIIVSDSSFPTGVDTDTMLNEQLLRDIEIRAKADIQALQAKLLDQLKKDKVKGVKIIWSIEGGEPEREIAAICHDYEPNLIIMGSSGIGKKGILMGSVSKKVMTRVHVPVLAIPGHYSYSGINNVVYMTDFSGPDKDLIERLFDLLKGFNIKVFCVHLNIHDSKKSENEMNMETLRSQLKGVGRKEKLTYNLIDSTDINNDIENFVRENNIDLIAFQSHKRNIFQNIFTHKVTKKNLFQANIPLLAFHI